MPRVSPQVSLIALLAALPMAASAQMLPPDACTPAPADNATLVCSGSGTGFTDDTLDGVTVTVQPGAVISGTDAQAFEAGDDFTVTNNGTITSDQDHAIQAGAGGRVENAGTITATYWDADAEEGADAVNLGDDALVLNAGTINGTDEGVQVGLDSEVQNRGTIIGRDRGIDSSEDEEDDNATFVQNFEGAVITGIDSDAVRIEGYGGAVTNRGMITGGDEGLDLGYDSVVENFGTITGADRGVDSLDGTQVTNHEGGVIRGLDSDAVRVDGDDARVYNYGAIYGADEAIQVGDDAVVENHGLLDADDKGIQADDDAQILNTGTILSRTEGIEAGDDAVITNRGTITTLDDAINAGERAIITNYGSLLVTGPQDGLDIDSGTVVNWGSIVSQGGEDGIDFDASDEAVSTITNHGLIEGSIGINVELGEGEDPANTQSQVVVNHGTITGTSGLALQLGAGDDTLDLHSIDIRGDVDLGAGQDSLIVRDSVQTGHVTFVSNPELVDLDEAPDAALYDSDSRTLAVASPEAFAGIDAALAGQTVSLGKAVMMPLGGTPAPALSFAEGAQPGRDWWVSGTAAVFDGEGSGRVTLGRDLDGFGVFLSHGVASGEAAGHDLTARTTLLGVTTRRALGLGGEVSGMAYAGFGRLDLDSAAAMSGDGETDTRSFGLAGAVLSAPSDTGLAFAARAGIERQTQDAFTVSGLGGATFGARDVTTGYVSAEARLTRRLPDGTAITPFVGADVLFSDGDDVTMTLGNGSTRFATGGDSSVAQMTLGVELGGADRPWALRVEGQYDENENAGLTVTAGLRF